MEYLTLGQRRDEWRDFPDGYLMSYDALNGLTLFFFLRSPDRTLLAQIGRGSAFEIGLADIRHVGFFTLRFGTLPWGDCAFAPCMFAPPEPLPHPAAGQRLPLNVIVIDSAQGVIVGMESIPLGHEFSVKLANWFHNRMGETLSGAEYRTIVEDAYAQNATEDLRRRANISWRCEKI